MHHLVREDVHLLHRQTLWRPSRFVFERAAGIEQGAVRVNDVRKEDLNEVISLATEIVLQVGPRRFVRLVKG